MAEQLREPFEKFVD